MVGLKGVGGRVGFDRGGEDRFAGVWCGRDLCWHGLLRDSEREGRNAIEGGGKLECKW